jgi:uncharacterized protein (DUF952 family)
VTRILHAALPASWAEALDAGSYTVSTRDRSLADVGFIHACTELQLGRVLVAFYSDLTHLELLVLDIAALEAAGSPVRWDDVPDQPAAYPHVYGPIATSVVGQGDPVVAVLPMTRSEDEPWAAPDLSAYDIATGPEW